MTQPKINDELAYWVIEQIEHICKRPGMYAVHNDNIMTYLITYLGVLGVYEKENRNFFVACERIWWMVHPQKGKSVSNVCNDPAYTRAQPTREFIDELKKYVFSLINDSELHERLLRPCSACSQGI